MAIGNSNIRNIGSSHIITASATSSVIWSKPVLLDLKKVNCKQTAVVKNHDFFLFSLTSLENPLIKTEFLANSHMSHEDIFQTWVAMLYSSIRGSLVKWNCKGSSVEREMWSPRAKYSGNGDLKNIDRINIIHDHNFQRDWNRYHKMAHTYCNSKIVSCSKGVTWQCLFDTNSKGTEEPELCGAKVREQCSRTSWIRQQDVEQVQPRHNVVWWQTY